MNFNLRDIRAVVSLPRVAEATQMPVHVADDPLTCVVRGTGVVLDEIDTMSRVLVADTYVRVPR